jgi:hypothetical protein
MRIWILAEMNAECAEVGTVRWFCQKAWDFSDSGQLRTELLQISVMIL